MSRDKGKYLGKVGLQQRVLPAYRVAFFDMLAKVCTGGLSLFAGKPRPGEQIPTTERLQTAHFVRGYNLHLLDVSSPLYHCWQIGLIGWLKNWQPDVLIVEANPRYLSTRLAVRWMHARGRPVLGWGLGAPGAQAPMALWRNWRRSSFLRSLDGMVAYSQRGAQEYRSLGFPAELVFTALNSVAPRPQAPPPPRPAGFLGRPNVLFVGRLQARKRIDNLLRACAALPEHLQPRLCIVGDGLAREELQALADRIYPPAKFTGALFGSELEEHYAAADLFVLPGTGGLAVQQAMAFGLPAIVAQGDGSQEDLVRGENGWLIPPDDLQALTEALQIALADPSQLRRMGALSYRIVTEEINLEAMAAVFLQALGRVQR